LIDAYGNGAYYVARAIDDYLRELLTRDPDSLIVVLGDHAPTLGPNFEGFRRGGRIAPDDPWPLARAALYEVPLLILDRGELLPVGRLPTYLIPYVVLDRLSQGAFCKQNGCAWQRPWRLRVFRDFAILVEAHSAGEILCAPLDATTAPCDQAAERSRAWQLEILKLVGADDATPSDLTPNRASG
jgi:hypothetical protein